MSSGGASRRFAHAVVKTRWVIVVFWIAAAALAWTQLPALGGGGSAAPDIVPSDAQALVAQEQAVRLFGVPAGSDLVVVQRRTPTLSQEDIAAQAQVARAAMGPAHPGGLLGAIPLVNVPLPGTKWNERNTTAVDYVFVDPSESLVDREDTARRYADRLAPAPGGFVGITGSAPARLEQFSVMEDKLPLITLATIAVIALLVTLSFRTPAAPLLTLGTAGLAYVIAVRVLAWGAERFGVDVPREIEPLLVVLLLGLVTDYSIFFLADARRQLRLGRERREAAVRATSRVAPTVLTAGTIVAACCACLLVAGLDFFRVFGPGMALCALIVTAVTVTLVPAMIAIAGPRLFGRTVREAAEAGPREAPVPEADTLDPPLVRDEERRDRWRRRLSSPLGAIQAGRREAAAEQRSPVVGVGVRVLAFRPVAAVLAIASVAGLLWAASPVRDLGLGISFVAGLPADSQTRQAQDQAAAGFSAGVTAPTDVQLQGAGVGRRVDAVERLRASIATRPGVAATLGPGARRAIARTGDDPRPLVSRDGDATRIVVAFTGDPTSATTIEAFRDLRRAMPSLLRDAGLPSAVRVAYGGETALGAESVDAVLNDAERLAIAIAVVTLLLLVVFLRALVAPVLLLVSGALGFLAALGLTTLAARQLWGDDQLTYYVPLVGAVLLVALGSDYNVLLAGRIRAEATRRRTREAIAVAVPQASHAITLAGVTLASTFALLALIPVRSFRELAILLTLGVLIDTLLVRSVLIPSLLAVAGRFAWWPSDIRRTRSEEAITDRVAGETGLTTPAAAETIAATLETLGERIGSREAEELAAHLPPPMALALTDHEETTDPFDYDEFLQRVADRTGASPAVARAQTSAVLRAIAAGIPATELDYVRATLSADYGPLMNGHAAARR